jgi:hypothetical protein
MEPNEEEYIEVNPEEAGQITYSDVNVYLLEADLIKELVQLIAKGREAMNQGSKKAKVCVDILEVGLVNIFKVLKG